MAKILLVGSDDSLKEMYQAVLSASGFDTILETSAKDGLDRLSDEFFPATVVFLPREETLWFIIKVRQMPRVKISSVPILALTEQALGENMSEYIETGATKAISKFPTSGDRLVKEVRSILNIPRMTPNQ